MTEPELPMEMPHIEPPPPTLPDLIYKQIAEWCEKNPIKHYGVYDDRLSDDQIALLLDGEFQKFDEALWQSEIDMSDYDDFSEAEAFKEMCKDLDLHIDSEDDLEDDDKVRAFDEDLLKEAFRENVVHDWSDFWKTCFNNASPHIVGILHWPGKDWRESDERVVEMPHWELDEDENNRRRKKLAKILTPECMKQEADFACYSFDILKVCGELDLWEIYKKQKLPTHVTVKTGDSLVTHNSYNGSGGAADFKLIKPYRFEVEWRNDKKNRYGVQEVFGFVESWWRNELDVDYRKPRRRKTNVKSS